MAANPSQNALGSHPDDLSRASNSNPRTERQGPETSSPGAEEADFYSFPGGGQRWVESHGFEPLVAAHEINWRELEPRGVYARVGRHLLNYILLTIVLLPVFFVGLVIACANWIALGDHKKVFFRQQRMGWKGTLFRIYKFRTMKDTKEDHFESWKGGREASRVNRFGQLLRKTHLDELPQIINILRGEMSFIGPRPEMVEVDAWARSKIDGWHERLGMKPGITGQAQITHGYAGGKVEEYEKKLAADLQYIEKLSFLSELGILLQTPAWMLKGRGGTAISAKEEPLPDFVVQPKAPKTEKSETPTSPMARVSSEA